MIKGFRDFILRGNVVDLAVAVVIGVAFGAVITALVKDILTPLIAAIFGSPDFSALTFTINNSQFKYGDFINAIIAFLAIALVIYFVVVVPMQKIAAMMAKPAPAPEVKTKKCPECLSDIPIKARKCMYCTSLVS